MKFQIIFLTFFVVAVFTVSAKKTVKELREDLIEEFKKHSHSSESKSCSKSKSCGSGSSESWESSEDSEDICKVLRNICKDKKKKGDFPHPKRCDLYVKCNKKDAIIKYCPSGSIFDRKQKICVRGDAETCTAITTTTWQPTTTTETTTPEPITNSTTPFPVTNSTTPLPVTNSTTTPIPPTIAPPNFEGLCRGIVFPAKNVPLPGTCVYYVRCLFGVGVLWECANNRIFDSSSRSCILGNQTTCQAYY